MQDMTGSMEAPSISKSVSITESLDTIPDSHALQDNRAGRKPAAVQRRHRASIGKKLSGRPPHDASTTSLASIGSTEGGEGLREDQTTAPRHHHHSHHVSSKVKQWLDAERTRRTSKRRRRAQRTITTGKTTHLSDDRHNSSDSDDMALTQLGKILAEAGLDDTEISTATGSHRPSYSARKLSIRHHLRRKSTAASSDTDYADGDVFVPSADVVLDNSKTLKYGHAEHAESTADLQRQARRKEKEKAAWLTFKHEITRLAHTLKLKGWRHVPLEQGGEITVERLSGAMTNAVYVVSPPTNLAERSTSLPDDTSSHVPRRPPPKLLLRIYGAQVEQLIDRESELGILRRLARKRIGPRLLGTFSNGRFEQFFQASTLTAQDLRTPETSKQIAKRMRELHDGVELLDEERDAGPFVWQNWDKWVIRCEEIMQWLDDQILNKDSRRRGSLSEAWRSRGLVCGVEWSTFRKVVEEYRVWLEEKYGSYEAVKNELVFAHNDTQYGNLLRLQPSGESPLLNPANEHKQLIVIDFEYANANVPAYELANHFTEWCYNYHDFKKPFAVTEKRYPTPEEQRRFVKAYVTHKPAFPSTAATPVATPSAGPSTSATSFMLDARMPYSQFQEEDMKKNEKNGREIDRLLRDTRLWRVVCSAQWTAWAIVSAKVEGMDESLEEASTSSTATEPLAADYTSAEMTALADRADEAERKKSEDPLTKASAERQDASPRDDEEGEFDYLGYAQERAMLFWGDVLQLGLVKKDELPQELLKKVKTVEY